MHLFEVATHMHITCRPSSAEVLTHCLFWTRKKQLAFFQDVSDRIEREPVTSSVVQALEQNSSSVVKGDWRNHISDELREGACYIILLSVAWEKVLHIYICTVR